MMGLCDKEIIDKIKTNKEEVFEQIYYEYKNLIFFIISGYSKCSNDADDLVQEVFMKIYQHLEDYNDGYASFKTWIAIITKNHAVDYSKTKKDIIYNDEIVYNAIDESTLPKFNIFSYLEDYLERDEIEFLTLRIAFNFSHKELSQIFNFSIDVTKKYFKKSMDKARKEWIKHEEKF